MIESLFRLNMTDYFKLHEEKYQKAKAAGLPGWGGADRIAKIPETLNRFRSYSGIAKSGKILEIGCGAGNVSLELAKLGYEVSGIDISPTAINWARESALREKLNINFSVGNVTDLSLFPNNFFDMIFDGNCLHCIQPPDRMIVLQECFRVLKSNGLLFISSLCAEESSIQFENGQPYRYITNEKNLNAELTAVGFEIKQQEYRAKSPVGHINVHAKKL